MIDFEAIGRATTLAADAIERRAALAGQVVVLTEALESPALKAMV